MATLSGKVSLITGASSGIGLATAVLFARRGAMVSLGGRDEGRLNEALLKCTEASGGHSDRFMTVVGDVTDAKVREELISKTVNKFGRLDILVANAGLILPNGALNNTTEESYDSMMDMNVKSVFFLIQQAVPVLEKTKGNIVSVSSVLATLASPSGVVYSMTKAAIEHMTRCLALDVGPKGIRVNAVKPSLIRTRMRRHQSGNMDEQYDKSIKMEAAKQPLGHTGEADDIAEAISFLASDAAKFITGECLDVGGGRCLTGNQPSAPPPQ